MVLTTRQSYRILAAITAALLLSACQSANPIQAINLNQAQGSSENISSLTAAINSNPQNPETYNVRGTAYGQAGEYGRAIGDFTQAIQIDPNYYQAYANRALVYRQQGKLTEAVQDYGRAVQINPSYDSAYIGRGNIYRVCLLYTSPSPRD